MTTTVSSQKRVSGTDSKNWGQLCAEYKMSKDTLFSRIAPIRKEIDKMVAKAKNKKGKPLKYYRVLIPAQVEMIRDFMLKQYGELPNE